MDAFAVAAVVAMGLDRLTYRRLFRLSWHFGIFQALMPVAGWFAGTAVSSLAASYAYLASGALLCLIGTHMLWESRISDKRTRVFDPTRGWSLVGLSLATSIDALAVGISFGLIGISIWFPACVIGAVTFIVAAAGAIAGRKAGGLLGPWAERLGGTALIFIGIRILLHR